MKNTGIKETRHRNKFPGYILFLVLLAVGFYSTIDTLPYQTVNSSELLNRAYTDIENIAKEPHMSGSLAHKNVRDYIVDQMKAIDVKTKIETSTVVSNYKAKSSKQVTAAYVENIIAQIEGETDLPAIALMAHYDSRDNTYGAGDNAAGVAAILSAARELVKNESRYRDIYFIFTDVEEYGLLGSQQFFQKNPLHQEIGLVINFEGRGSSGPAILFETGDGNYSVIKHSAAATKIQGSSLLYSIYKNMNNDTDLSSAKKASIQGLNFAFADGFYDYHTSGDTVENLSASSLMGQLNYAIDLSRYFVNLRELSATDETLEVDDATFFNPIPGSFIYYGTATTYFIGILAILTSLLWLYKQVKVVNLKSIVRGFLVNLLIVLLIGTVVTVSNYMLYRSFDIEAVRFWKTLYQYHFIIAAYVLLVFGMLFGSVVMISEVTWVKFNDISIGVILIWLLLLMLTLMTAPYASYILAWPLLIFSVLRLSLDVNGMKMKLLLSSLELTVIGFLMLPLSYQVYVFVGHFYPFVPVTLFVLSMLLATSSLETMGKAFGNNCIWFVIVGIGLTVFIGQNHVFNQRFAQPTSIYYLQDENNNQQYLASNLTELHGWDEEVMGETPQSINSNIIWPNSNDIHWVKSVDTAKLDAAQVTVLEDTTEGLKRNLKILVKSPMKAEYLNLFFKPTIWYQVSLEDIDIPNLPEFNDVDGSAEWWRWRFYAIPEEGLTLELVLAVDQPLEMRLIEVIYSGKNTHQLPLIPAGYMPLPYDWSSSNVIIQNVNFSNH